MSRKKKIVDWWLDAAVSPDPPPPPAFQYNDFLLMSLDSSAEGWIVIGFGTLTSQSDFQNYNNNFLLTS